MTKRITNLLVLFIMVCCAFTNNTFAQNSGTDVLFLIDNSLSMSTTQRNNAVKTVKTIANEILDCDNTNRIAVAHYAYDLTRENHSPVWIDFDFTTNKDQITALRPKRPDGGGLGSGDDLEHSVRVLGDALDGTANSYIKSPITRLNHDPNKKLVLFIITDATRADFDMKSFMVKTWRPLGILSEDTRPGVDPFESYNQFKRPKNQGGRGAEIIMFRGYGERSFESSDDKWLGASAAITSIGGDWQGIVEANPNDPQGSGTKPRKMIYNYYNDALNMEASQSQINTLVNMACEAACEDNVTANLKSTNVSCGNNGSIEVNLSSNDVRLFLYKEGNNRPLVEASNITNLKHTFATLSAGTYRVEGRCIARLDKIYFNRTITITDTYQPISNVALNSSTTCSNFAEEGSISVTGVTGGTAPYTYSFIKNDSPAYDDALSQYQSSPTMTVNGYGTYQIRVKDACGNFFTVTREIANNTPPVRLEFNSEKTACGITTFTYLRTKNADTNAILTGNFATLHPNGVKLIIRQDSPTGKIVYNGIYTGQPIQVETASTNNANKVPTYYYTTTNACGVSANYNTIQYDGAESVAINTVSVGCAPNEMLKMEVTPSKGLALPVSVAVKDESGRIIKNLTFNDRNTQFVDVPIGKYSVVATDKCGISVTNSIENPKNIPPVLKVRNYLNNWCNANLAPLTLTNAIQALVHIESGYIPDAENATATIISGPSNVGVKGVPSGFGRWVWSNLLMGDYVVAIESCGTTFNLPLTVNTPTALKQSLNSKAASVCSGGGNITSEVVYNGAYQNIVELLDANGRAIAENSTGNFTNLPAGTYTTRLKITINKCDDPSKVNTTYYITGDTVTLTGSSTGPKVSGVALVCEAPTSTGELKGMAHLNIQGVAPYSIKYKLRNSTTWINTFNNINTNDFSIDGLTPNETYTVEVVDACGKSFVGDYRVGTITDNFVATTTQPCVGESYTLSGTFFAGATYRWINPAGAVVTTEKDYHIPSYNESYDGIYTLETMWGDCVIRRTQVSIYGGLCGQPISNKGISGNVFFDTTENNIVDGTGIGIADKTQLYVSLVIASETGEVGNRIFAVVKVNEDGTYTLPGVPRGNYALILGTNPKGSNQPSLPLNWVNTGEAIPSNATGDAGQADGIIFIVQNNTDIINANFGINRKACYKPANTSGTALKAKFGITALGRADDGSGKTWPTVRTGAHAVLEAKTKGFVINRVNNPQTDISSPVEGMVVYDNSKDCLSLYDGTSWKCLTQPSCPD